MSLTIAPEVAHLSVPSFWRWFLPVLGDWLVIVLAMYFAVTYNVWWVYLLAIIVIGSRQHALMILGHDGAHGFALSHLPTNDLFTNIFCFWPVGMNLKTYRSYHFKHHKNVGTVNDPELVSKFWSEPNWDLPLSKRRLFGYFLLDLSGIGFLVYKRKLITYNLRRLFSGQSLVPVFEKIADSDGKMKSNRMISIPQIFFLTFLIFDLVLSGWWAVVVLWVVSFLTAGFAFFRLQVWTEHLGTFATNRIHANWWQALIIFPHYTWYHYEHHKWSSVPHWNLPQARKLDTEVAVLTVSEFFDSLMRTSNVESGSLPDGREPVNVPTSV